MKLAFIFVMFTVAFELVSSEKILVISFFSSKSHKLTYFRLIEELAKRGHEITIVSPVKPFKEVKGIKEVFTFDVYESQMWKDFNAFEMKETGASMNPFLMLHGFDEICGTSYDLPQVQDILKQKFDLVFMQPLFNDCVLGIVYRLNVPFILFFPTSVPGYLVKKIGGHFPSSYVGNFFLGYSDEMTFRERFINFGADVMFEAILKFYFEPHMAGIYREKLGQDIPSVTEILANASLVFSNGHFSLAKPKPMLPDVIDVGGLHSHPANPLPKDLEDFIQKSGKDGFILFSMGSAIKGSLMPEEKRKMFLRVFGKLKQQVLWKWETETMSDLPKNVKLSKWLPQQDLLGHQNIKMFITHCGGGSTEESIYHGVPLLGLPMFGDQNMNAKQAMNQGFLVKLEWNDLTEEKLTNGINEILNNPKYAESAKKLSKVFSDQPMQPLDRGVYWVEYILRHKGAPQLRSAARKLNFFQYHSYDVMAAYLAIFSTILFIIFAILRFIVRKICSCFGSSSSVPPKSKAKKQKKNQ